MSDGKPMVSLGTVSAFVVCLLAVVWLFFCRVAWSSGSCLIWLWRPTVVRFLPKPRFGIILRATEAEGETRFFTECDGVL